MRHSRYSQAPQEAIALAGEFARAKRAADAFRVLREQFGVEHFSQVPQEQWPEAISAWRQELDRVSA